MKTKGEIEAAICQAMNRFQQAYMGRGTKDIRAHLLGDFVVVRMLGVLNPAEQKLIRGLPAEKGRDLVKQVRTQLMEAARPLLAPIIHEITGVHILSVHHDLSTLTGEAVVMFSLKTTVATRERRPG